MTDIKDKIKKLTGALYRVTDLFPDKEPLKWVLRNKAASIYENLVILNLNSLKNKNEIIDETFFLISQIVEIFDLVSESFFISGINFKILKKEYVSLMDILEGKKGDILEEVKLLSSSSFAPLAEQKIKSKNPIGHIGQNHIGQGVNANKNGREVKIFDFLKNNGAKTTGEITSIFTGISEKSVQRELLKMVEEGKLRAEGEKRWRKYGILND
jgi:hypothetical protein